LNLNSIINHQQNQ